MDKTDLKPTDTEYATSIDLKKVKQVYIGGDECCRCGCMGKYYTDEKNIKRLRTLAKNKIETGEVSMDYLLKNGPNGHFAEYINFSYPSNNKVGRAITFYFE